MNRINLANGVILLDGIIIGEVAGVPGNPNDPPDESGAEQPTLTLNLGWTKAAGVRVIVHGVPGVDRKRDGIILDR